MAFKKYTPATRRYKGMEYKRGHHGFAYVLVNGDWRKSEIPWYEVEAGESELFKWEKSANK